MMPALPAIVIVGGGVAGHTLAASLSTLGYRGSVTLIGEERHAPYDRPPLSKAFQLGDESTLLLEPAVMPGVQILAGQKAMALHTQQRTLELDDGRQLPWDRLVLATGTRPRMLPGIDADAPVLTLRTLDDARIIRSKLCKGVRLTIIGGGPIGLELAASARHLGAQVTVLEAAGRLMARSAPAGIADILLEHHRATGIEVQLDAKVSAIGRNFVELANAQRIETDLLVVGIGVVANDEIARDAGIAADDGIFIDCQFRTTQPDVYAIGDVVRQRHPISGRFERIETWSNARGQAQALAQLLHQGHATDCVAQTPWYWSDQGSLRLQCAGLITGDTDACRGDVLTGLLRVQWSGGRLVGVAAINAPHDFARLRRMLDNGENLTPEEFAISNDLTTRPNDASLAPSKAAPAPSTPNAETGASTDSPALPTTSMAAVALRDIKEGGIGSACLPDGTRIAIYRIRGEEIFATDDKCSHGSSSLCDEGSLEGHVVECGLHLGSFDVRTGLPVSTPCTKAIRSYPAQVRDGTIWISTEPNHPHP